MAGKVNFQVLEGTTYIGDKNDMSISKNNAHYNSYFNIDMAQSAYFTMLIEGFQYNRFHSSYMSTTTSPKDGRSDYSYVNTPNAFRNVRNSTPRSVVSSSFDNFGKNGSIYWMPLKSLSYNQGTLETANIAVGAFADLHLPFRKHSPTLTVEMYDHRSDFFEMKLREWHNMSVLSEGFVPVLESICRTVQIRSWATNGECNSLTECQCILADDINITRSYDGNDLKLIQFKLIVVGWGSNV